MRSKNRARSSNFMLNFFSQLSTVCSEFCLIIFLFINSTLSNLASKFAKHCTLQIPCFICSKLYRKPWFSSDSICDAHKLEISSLSYCERHNKLCFAQSLCQTCDISCSNIIKETSNMFQSEKIDCSCCFRKKGSAQNAPKGEENITERKEKHFEMNGLIDLETESNPKFKNQVTDTNNISDSRNTNSNSNGLDKINWNQIRTIRTSCTGTNTQIISDPSPSKQIPCHVSIKRMLSNRGPFQSPRPSEIISSKENLTTHDDIQNLFSQIAPTPKVGLKSPSSALFDESVEPFDVNMMSDVEQESDVAKLRRQVEMGKRNMRVLYMELEEERNASDIAASEAMAMINRLQKEKAAIKMESLQYLRMMEEEAEHDKEAIESLNELLTQREKEFLDLEAEIEEFKKDFLKFENESLVLGFEEKEFVSERLRWLEGRVEMENGEKLGVEMENGELRKEVSKLNERFERIVMDQRFINHVLGGIIEEGNEGIKFIEEIASHLRELRKITSNSKN